MSDRRNFPRKPRQGPRNEPRQNEVDPKVAAAVADIAEQLKETDPAPVYQIQRIIEQLGMDTAYTFLQEALDIEAKGGLLTSNENRRRTPGGVFFHIVRKRISDEERKLIFPRPTHAQRKARARQLQAKRPRQFFPWRERGDIWSEASEEQGEDTDVKITLVGRPGKTIKINDVMVTAMLSGNPPSLPKDLPRPPSEPTAYMVYIAMKQWRKVSAAISNPEDKLIIEGFPFSDKKLGVIAVLAQSVTTTLMERQKREKNAS